MFLLIIFLVVVFFLIIDGFVGFITIRRNPQPNPTRLVGVDDPQPWEIQAGSGQLPEFLKPEQLPSRGYSLIPGSYGRSVEAALLPGEVIHGEVQAYMRVEIITNYRVFDHNPVDPERPDVQFFWNTVRRIKLVRGMALDVRYKGGLYLSKIHESAAAEEVFIKAAKQHCPEKLHIANAPGHALRKWGRKVGLDA